MSSKAFSAWQRAGFKQRMDVDEDDVEKHEESDYIGWGGGRRGGPLVEDVWWKVQYGALTVVKSVRVIQAAELL